MKILIIILSLVFFSGCSAKKEFIKQVEYKEKECVVSLPDKLIFNDVNYVIIDKFWIAMNPDNYEKLSNNISELLRYKKQSDLIILNCLKQ